MRAAKPTSELPTKQARPSLCAAPGSGPELSVRATNVLNDNGCGWESEAEARAFAANAVKSGRAAQWRNCGKIVIAELREWSGLNDGPRTAQAIAFLEARGFTVITPNH